MRSFLAALMILFAASISTASPIMPGLIRGAQGRGLVVPAAPPVASAAYGTSVIFGDIQGFVNAAAGNGTDGGRYNDLIDQVDWAIANKTIENIRNVVVPGDQTDSGDLLPLTGCEAIDGSPLPSFLTCFNHGANQGTCEAEYRCGFSAAVNNCAECALVDLTSAEWTRSDLQIARLVAAGIPVIVATGNNDNLGLTAAACPLCEPFGIDVSRYDSAYYDANDNSFGSRAFEHLSDNDLGANGIAHEFMLDLDVGVPVLLLTVPFISNVGIPAAHQTWAISRCAAHPTMPVRIVAHDA